MIPYERWIDGSTLLVDHGPMQMTISAFGGHRVMRDCIEDGAAYAVELLGQLASYVRSVPSFLNPWPRAKAELGVNAPLVARLMLNAVEETGSPDLTPMAAVAGAIADLVADALLDMGCTKVLVNNGGDIAVRLGPGEVATVGISSSVDSVGYSHILTLEESCWGVATSGLGGRSLSLGIADAAVVVAGNARTADACATVVANHTTAEHPAVARSPAEEIDPCTDIPGHLVTVGVGTLPGWAARAAVGSGYRAARSLCDRGIARGFAIFCGGFMAVYPRGLLRQNGNGGGGHGDTKVGHGGGGDPFGGGGKGGETSAKGGSRCHHKEPVLRAL